ncbi:MAG: anti-sigma factor family protein [Steroidobacteraceae bacterium]
MQCAESLRVQAYFDGELDALSSADVERHSERCAKCQSLLQDLEQLRSTLRQDLTYPNAPPELRARIMRALDKESATSSATYQRKRAAGWRLQPFWRGAFSGVGGTGIAASIAFFLLAPPLAKPIIDDLVGAHERSLMPEHLIDVVSTDRHTVKPWFSGHADVSPVVADFDADGYKLIGGRADYFDHQRAAVVVYQHGAHVINVFSWAATEGAVPKDTTRDGYHLAFWKSGNLMYCAVSDTAWDELLGLAKLLQNLSARDIRG